MMNRNYNNNNNSTNKTNNPYSAPKNNPGIKPGAIQKSTTTNKTMWAVMRESKERKQQFLAGYQRTIEQDKKTRNETNNYAEQNQFQRPSMAFRPTPPVSASTTPTSTKGNTAAAKPVFAFRRTGANNNGNNNSNKSSQNTNTTAPAPSANNPNNPTNTSTSDHNSPPRPSPAASAAIGNVINTNNNLNSPHRPAFENNMNTYNTNDIVGAGAPAQNNAANATMDSDLDDSDSEDYFQGQLGGYRDGYDTNTTSPNTDITRQQDRQQQQPQQQQGAMKQPNSLASAMAAFQDIEHGFPRQPQLQQSQLLDEATPEQPAPVTVEITEKLISDTLGEITKVFKAFGQIISNQEEFKKSELALYEENIKTAKATSREMSNTLKQARSQKMGFIKSCFNFSKN